MRIAYISFEYPPDTAFGGIATYVYQMANSLAQHNIDVSVFTASKKIAQNTYENINGVKIYKIPYKHKKDYAVKIATYFSVIHKAQPFNLIESAEFGADALVIKKLFPNLPLVVKFHMSSYLINSINKLYKPFTLKEKVKKALHLKQYKKEKDKEYQLTMLATALTTPSISLGTIMSKDWNIDTTKIFHLPNPYTPNKNLLNIDAESNATNIVTYIGRLEVRKGMLKLIETIKLVLQIKPTVKFRLIGKSEYYNKVLMIDYIKKELGILMQQVEWIDNIPNHKIVDYLANTDICVYPSIWENFPNTCLEAMAAARGIVASKEGGMRDMLQDINGGILINPNIAEEIANGIVFLLDNPSIRKQMGARSRNKILTYYQHQVVIDTITFYKKIVNNE